MKMINEERKLNLIRDNAQIHKAEVTKIVADILNINIIYLPAYSPFSNPIEKIWQILNENYIKSIMNR